MRRQITNFVTPSILPHSWDLNAPSVRSLLPASRPSPCLNAGHHCPHVWCQWQVGELGKDEKSMEQVRTCRSVMNFNPTQIDPCHGSRKAKPVAQPTLLLNLLRCRQAQGETTATTWQQVRISFKIFKQIVFMTPFSHYPGGSICTRKEDPDCVVVKKMQRATSNSNPLQGNLYPVLCYGCQPIWTCQHLACCLTRHLQVLICPSELPCNTVCIYIYA